MSNLQTVQASSFVIDAAYSQPAFELEGCEGTSVNEVVIVVDAYNPKSSVLARHLGNNEFTRLPTKIGFQNFYPRDASQSAYMANLMNPDILLNVATGTAGTGKSSIAVAYAFERYTKDKRKIILTKPTRIVGDSNALGPVPGDIAEKLAPYLASYEIILKKLLGGGKSYIEQMQAKGHLEFVPIELVRGCTFENTTLIVDEAQNCDWHTLNTLISRMGEKSEMILCGDLAQVDGNIRRKDSGLHKLVNSKPFKDSPIASHAELKVQYRSPICKLAADVNEWLHEENERQEEAAGSSRDIAWERIAP